MKTTHHLRPSPPLCGFGLCLTGIMASLLLTCSPVFAQKIFTEDFEELALGPNVDEALVGTEVWTSTPPVGWDWDASQMPGVGIPDQDGVTEWSGWGFADKVWWVTTAEDQRRSEFSFGSGTVAIADPDEWDDADHAVGLWNAYITTPSILIEGQAADSLVLAFASSWRPEAHDDGPPDFPGDANGDPINDQTAIITAAYDDGSPAEVLHWDSVSGSPTFHDHTPNETVLVPLNNPAGASSLKIKFGLEQGANDWWWAVDNIAVGVPPFVTSITNSGYAFGVNIVEALGKTVNQASIAVDLDGTALTGINVLAQANGVWVVYDQFPDVFTPGQEYTVDVHFTSSDNRQIVDTIKFIAPSFTKVTSTPTTVTAVINDDVANDLVVDETSGIQVSLDGASITPDSTTRNGNALTITYSQAPTVFDSQSTHLLSVTFQTTYDASVTDAVSFVTPLWIPIPSTLGTAPSTGAEAGMRWRTYQVETGPGTSIAGAEDILAGTLGPDLHDPAGYATPEGADGFFRIDWVNFEQEAADAGNFNTGATAPQNVADEGIPGIPGLGSTNRTDNIAGEALTFLELQAGIHTMVVNSDDGFQVTTGTADHPTYLVLGAFDSGRGEADTAFYFNVEEAGVYFFRLLWFEGGGGASVEWFTVNEDGSRALVNGEQTGSIPSFRTRTVPEPDIPSGGEATFDAPSVAGGEVTLNWTGTGTLQESSNLADWSDVTPAPTGNTYSVTPDTGNPNKYYRILVSP